jgi:hypothetical protein
LFDIKHEMKCINWNNNNIKGIKCKDNNENKNEGNWNEK